MKRIVICCDGTWNTRDKQDSTNVVKMADAVLATDSNAVQQIIYYDEGVGTHWGLDRLSGGAFGIGLYQNVKQAYRFLVDNFAEGDELYLFGFSRGAYTVRSLAGLIRKAGILNKRYAHKATSAYQIYRSSEVKPDDEMPKKFRKTYSKETTIKFLGVWDTVGALGVPIWGLRLLTRKRYQFHDVKLSRSVENAFHAVAIDENRKAFMPTLWEKQDSPTQVVEQVWFAGTHSNIGGGYAKHGLSDVAFMWMKERAERCGLVFEPTLVEEIAQPDPLDLITDARKGFFRLIPRYFRQIGDNEKDSCESVDASVKERREALESYRPPNLEDYLAKNLYG